MTRFAGITLTTVLLAGCGTEAQSTSSGPSDAGAPEPPTLDASPEHQTARVTADSVDTQFVVREHFLASGEMQISGEPFAEAMGRDLSYYSRDFLPINMYFDQSPNSIGFWIDLTGFSTAVESYEYSKQPMNNVAFESGAGTSLVHGPLVDKTGSGGPAATAAMAAKIMHFAQGSGADGHFVFPAGTYPVNNSSGNVNPMGKGDPAQNPLGWPGIWPTVHVFKSFSPVIDPVSTVDLTCSVTNDDSPGSAGSLASADYECDASSLHLPNRSMQVDPTVTPGADGFTAWKYGLWVLNYLQVMHDDTQAGVASVAESDLPLVGTLGNKVVGADDSGMPTGTGTYLGSSSVEGFQAQMFIEEIDNRAEDWLSHLSTKDGSTLTGFPSIKAAIDYDYASPLQWFPSEIGVTETDDGSGFPLPVYNLKSANSSLMDAIGMTLGYSEFLAITDTDNVDVGAAQTARCFFDGDPFAADDQSADGEATLHDRSLAMLRVALVNLDRMHTDPATGVLVDDVTVKGTTVTRGNTVSTPSVAYAILALRTARRALSSQLELYSNNVPDSAFGLTPLDTVAIKYPKKPSLTFSQRLDEILRKQADLLLDHLTDSTGRAFLGWDVQKQAVSDSQDALDAHTAAVRGLYAAYLSTGDTRYRDRARAVFDRFEHVFYDPDARMYTATPAPVDEVVFTPLRFGLLQSALRDVYLQVAARPGGEALEPELEARVGRLNKLVLNGWDDRNQNRVVDWPDECVNVQDGLPRGGLEMAERTLTGEIGSLQEKLDGGARTATSDREHDCVPEVDDAKLPAALAASVTFKIHRSK